MKPRKRSVPPLPAGTSFPGGGEVARLIRETDWSDTSLGAIDTWPVAFRTALRLCLASPLPCAVYWGPELRYFYNDALLGALGARHPDVLGRPAHEAWAELWSEIGVAFERIMKQGGSLRMADVHVAYDRGGGLEESYFDVTFSPVSGDGGGIEGIFGVGIETTQRVVGQRRAAALYDLGRTCATALASSTACSLAAEALSRHGADVPFCLLYTVDQGKANTATLAGACGIEPGTSRAPRSVDLDAANAPWPFAKVIAGIGEGWVEGEAVVLPIAGDTLERAEVILVVGLNPRLPCDARYREFLWALRDAIGAALTRAHMTQLRCENERQVGEILEALRTSEARLRLALETAHIYSWEADLETGRVTRSSNHAEVLGFSMPDGMRAGFEQTHPEDRHLVDAAFERALKGDGIFEVECRVLHPLNGRVIWKRNHGVRFPGADGAPGRMVGITQNITDIKRGQENVRRDQRNSEFLNQLEVLISPLLEADEIVSIATRRLGEYLDLTRCFVAQMGDRLTIVRGDWRRAGLASISGIHPLDGIMPGSYLTAFHAGQSVVVDDIVAEAIAPDVRERLAGMGGRAYLAVPYVSGLGWESTVVALRDTPRDWEAHEVQLLRDVSGRLWPAVKRARAERAMRDSEERFRTMADSSPVMIWITDARGRIEFANRAFMEFFGIQGQRRAREFAWTDVLHPEDREAHVDAFNATLMERVPFHTRTRLRRHDGAMRWVESRGNPRIDPQGHVTGVIGSSPDITEIFESQEALREADRRKDEFLAMLSHELRNPLAPIVNATRILRRLGPLGPEMESVREMIERQAEQLTALVDDLLDVSRVTQGRVHLQKTNLELMAVIARAIETSRPVIDARKHHLAVSLPSVPVRVEGDVTRLAQSISNLLINAAKYTDDGGQIELKAEIGEGCVLVKVKDNGIGLTQQELARVFDLFTQAERALDRAQGGLGIGLTVVKKLVEMHGGQVYAYSEGHGRGSEFVISLPTVAALAEERKNAPPMLPRRPLRTRVLVVDDNTDSATSMSLLLKLDGHDVKTAHDGPAALAAAKSFLPKVILLDIGLPGMSGYDVARELRRDEAFAETTLIALTGYGQADDRRKSKAAGFDHHLTKPVDDLALATVLDSMQGSGPPST